MAFSIATLHLCQYSECRHAGCGVLITVMVSVIVQGVVFTLRLSVIMLIVIMLSVIMLSAIILSVIMLSVILLSVIMLGVIMLSVIMLSVVASQGQHQSGRTLASSSYGRGFKFSRS